MDNDILTRKLFFGGATVVAVENEAQAAMSGLLFVGGTDQDEESRVGGRDQEMKVLKEKNELEEFQNVNWRHGSV